MTTPYVAQALAITGSVRTQPGTVLAVTSRSQVTVQVDAPDAANDRSRDACSPGSAGSNAGGSIKVEACAQSSGAIELFLPMGYAIEPREACAIHLACDKGLETYHPLHHCSELPR